MKLVLNNPSLPRCFASIPKAAGIVLEKDLGVGHGRLKAKLLVFDTPKSLRAFWGRCLGKADIGANCLGAVNGLIRHHERRGKKWLSADARYFCVIGLTIGHLSMEIISHESVHAGFNFVNRKSRSPWDSLAVDLDEELVAYPSGKIAAAINRAVHTAGLYEK